MLRPIWLIGMMGSGKSTVAPLVAAALDCEWVDADAVIEEEAGRSIIELFGESEASFRAVEVDVIRSLAGGHAVVATGGGAIMTEAADIMRASGLVVWLRATIGTLRARIGTGEERPLLADGFAAIEQIDGLRRDRYAGLADVVVDTDDRSPEEIAELVVEAWTSALPRT
ncbi:MAG: shikimate kinase [Acidimicrobiia bacterium]